MSTSFADLTPSERVTVLRSETYGMVFLGLANAAYAGASDRIRHTIAQALLSTINGLPPLPDITELGIKPPTAFVPGGWSLDWGPAFPSSDLADHSNMIYIASYRDTNDQPYFYVVGIRGTDVSTTKASIVRQVLQDFNAFETVPWNSLFTDSKIVTPPAKTGPTQQGNVAKGSFGGAKTLITSDPLPPSDQKKTQVKGHLAAALSSLLDGNSAIPIVVTGHSLGGCQTQTIASFLDWYFPDNTVIPHAFAPSTAGDTAFINNSVFDYGGFWFNTLDLVPLGYVTFYNSDTQQFPDAVVDPNADTVTEGVWLGASWGVGNLWGAFPWSTSDSCDIDQSNLTLGPPLPFDTDIAKLLEKYGDDLIGHYYARPSSPDVLKKMPGTVPDACTLSAFYAAMNKVENPPESAWSDSLTQLEWQHFPPNYKILLWQYYSDSMVYFDY
jgi:hypothetical protein